MSGPWDFRRTFVAAAQDLIARMQPGPRRKRIILDIHHVGVGPSRTWKRPSNGRCGIKPTHKAPVIHQGVEEVLFAVGTSSIQLLGALGGEAPTGRFLAARGPGLHEA